MKVPVVLLFVISFSSVLNGQEPLLSEKTFRTFMQTGHNNGRLQLNGFYNNVQVFNVLHHEIKRPQYEIKFDGSTDTLYCAAPVIFFNNGLIAFGNFHEFGKQRFINDFADPYYLSNRHSLFRWGAYTTRGDTVEALIYVVYFGYGGSAKKPKLTHFMGIIKDANTIIDWHAVPPYPPKVDKRQLGIEPSELSFISLPEKTRIDSSKAWINKYRE